MADITCSIQKIKHTVTVDAEKVTAEHPYIAFIIVLFGLPAALLTAVFASASIVMLPIAYISGWL